MQWIYYELETPDVFIDDFRQTVLCWATNLSLLAKLCFGSNTKETTKQQGCLSDFFPVLRHYMKKSSTTR